MNRAYHNKLVRDGIKDKIESKGETCSVRIIEDDAEFQQELLKKVKEEAFELASTTNRTDFLKEYADLMVVLDKLTNLMEFTEADIKVAIEENVKNKGYYNERHFLHWSEDSSNKSNETSQGIKKE